MLSQDEHRNKNHDRLYNYMSICTWAQNKTISYIKSLLQFYLTVYTDNNVRYLIYTMYFNYFRDLKKKQERDSDELQQKKKDAEAAVSVMCDKTTPLDPTVFFYKDISYGYYLKFYRWNWCREL